MAASFFHSAIQANIAHKLIEVGKYRTFTELTVSINGTDYKPDVCLYPFQKLDWQLDRIKVEEVPLMVVEILSPTQGTQELVEKTKIFLEAGVKSCWLVTVHPQTVSVYSSFDSKKVFIEGNVVDETLDINIPFDSVFL